MPVVRCIKVFHYSYNFIPTVYRRNSDLLRTGGLGGRNPVRERFSVPFRQIPRPTHPPTQWTPGISRRYSDRSVVLTNSRLGPGFEWVVAIFPHRLCGRPGMSWGEHIRSEIKQQVTSSWSFILQLPKPNIRQNMLLNNDIRKICILSSFPKNL